MKKEIHQDLPNLATGSYIRMYPGVQMQPREHVIMLRQA
jgi:hypothetical protein